MKFLPFLAAAGLLAAPAGAELAHRTSVVHNGRTIAVSYEPKIETRLRQAGLGPRSQASCLWDARIAVRRVAATAEGQAIPALTRVLDDSRPRSGARLGHCSSLADDFAASDAALRTLLSDVAGRDSAALRGELASLDALTAPASHAR